MIIRQNMPWTFPQISGAEMRELERESRKYRPELMSI